MTYSAYFRYWKTYRNCSYQIYIYDISRSFKEGNFNDWDCNENKLKQLVYQKGAVLVGLYASDDAFKDYGNAPDPLFGNSVYDIIPEKIGLAFFFVFTAIVWFWWPIKLLQIHADKSSIGNEEEVETPHLLSHQSK